MSARQRLVVDSTGGRETKRPRLNSGGSNFRHLQPVLCIGGLMSQRPFAHHIGAYRRVRHLRHHV